MADDWVTVGAPAEAAPADPGDWVSVGAPAAAEAPKSGGSSILDFFKGLGGGAVRGLARFSQDVGQGNSPEMGGTGTSNPEVAPDAAKVTSAVGVNPTGDGGYGDTIGQTLGNPASYFGPGGIVGKLLTGTTSAIGSKFLGDLAKGSPYEGAAALAGGVLGGAAPSTAARVFTPFPAEATRLGLVNTLKKEGVPVTAGEKTGNMGLRYVENYLDPNLNAPQAEAFTAAAGKRAGISSNRLTPDVMNKAHNDIGGVFDTVGGRNTFTPDAQYGHDVSNTITDYINNTLPSMRAPIVEKSGNDLLTALAQGNGTMPGSKYTKLRSDLSTAARAQSDSTTRFALQDLTGALDDAFERSLTRGGSADVGQLGVARRQYRNLLVLDRAMSAAGPGTAEGLVSPAQLANAAKTLQGKTQWVRGKGDFADLTRAGQGILKPLPDSGTAWRNRLHDINKGFSGIIGALVGQHANGLAGAGEGGIAGLLMAEQLGEPILRKAQGAAIMNPLTQKYLGNQFLPHVPGLLSTAPLQPFAAAMSGSQ
jgi:hypothetical protein